MKNTIILLYCMTISSCKVQSQTTINTITDAFATVKTNVDTTKQGTSVHIDTTVLSNCNYTITQFKYSSSGKIINFKLTDSSAIQWSTIVTEDIGLPPTLLKYTVSKIDNTIVFKKDNLVLQNTDPEYASITNTFIVDALALKAHQRQNTKQLKNGKLITIDLGQTVALDNKTALTLTEFVTKRVYKEQPSYARADLQLVTDNTTTAFRFIKRFLQDIAYPQDTVIPEYLTGYTFRLITFKFNESVTILVSKYHID
ncbi:hypothetical protein [Olleya sp. Bg11-27]|uniref:hypothetical protein n=1 Tax=Olleya sp. Bg11-27 TaxID=2058135 RepID=UPI0012FD61FD|nr:hypothetical protein [Olleya sp. Bg11-27]